MTPWTHHRHRRRVSAYLDGELDPQTSAAVARHLARCWACNSVLEDLRLIKASLRHLGRAHPERLEVARLRRWTSRLSKTRAD